MALFWNAFEATNAWRVLPAGLPPWMFGEIIGSKGERIDTNADCIDA